MSTLKTTNLQNASAASPAIVLAADGSATANLSSVNGGAIAGSRNRIINGDMRIDQRNAGAIVTSAPGGTFSVDRFASYASGGGVYTTQRSIDVPTGQGFVNSIINTVTTTDSPTGSDYYLVEQSIEGFNSADLEWGTAAAKSVAISFWVKSSLTGTYTIALRNGGLNRAYRATYTIGSANTWEQKTITVAGDTTGTWLTDNGRGISVGFTLGSGSNYISTGNTWSASDDFAATGQTQWIGTNGATFYITGVQLEPGTVATPFERRSYGAELALCQRYFQKTFGLAGDYLGYGMGIVGSSTGAYRVCIPIIVPMRTGPTLDIFSTSLFDGSNAPAVTSTGTVRSTPTSYSIDLNASSGGLTGGRPAQLLINPGTTNYVSLSAEL